jgi:hypothetical protein
MQAFRENFMENRSRMSVQDLTGGTLPSLFFE